MRPCFQSLCQVQFGQMVQNSVVSVVLQNCPQLINFHANNCPSLHDRDLAAALPIQEWCCLTFSYKPQYCMLAFCPILLLTRLHRKFWQEIDKHCPRFSFPRPVWSCSVFIFTRPRISPFPHLTPSSSPVLISNNLETSQGLYKCSVYWQTTAIKF